VRRHTGVHDPAENLFTMARHVECVDCHNPHSSRERNIGAVRGTLGTTVKGPTSGVKGVTITGREIEDSRFTYEICFKCHGDSARRPRNTIARQLTQTNARLEFQPSNPSFHPVAGPRRNPDVVSLIPPLRVGSTINCIDCHNSDNSRFEGGTGANGPHGSLYEPLLVANYDTADFSTESATAYALCYKCHDRQSILNNESFPLHNLHIVTLNTPCSVCHDAHGIYRGQGNSTNHSSLINFDLSVVSAADSPTGRRLEYNDTGHFAGNCTLMCHGVTHVNFPYAGTGAHVARRSRTSQVGASR
jgi:hypothetical protein